MKTRFESLPGSKKAVCSSCPARNFLRSTNLWRVSTPPTPVWTTRSPRGATAEAASSVNPVSPGDFGSAGLFCRRFRFLFHSSRRRRTTGNEVGGTFFFRAPPSSPRGRKRGRTPTRLFHLHRGNDSGGAGTGFRKKATLPKRPVKEAKRCLLCECMECVKHCALHAALQRVSQEVRAGDLQQPLRNPGNEAGERHDQLVHSLRPLRTHLPQRVLHGRSLQRSEGGEMLRQEKMPPFGARLRAGRDMRFNNSPKATLLRHEPGKKDERLPLPPGLPAGGLQSRTGRTALYAFLRDRLDGGRRLLAPLLRRSCGLGGARRGTPPGSREDHGRVGVHGLAGRRGPPARAASRPSARQCRRYGLSLYGNILEGRGASGGGRSLSNGTLAVAGPLHCRRRAPEIRNAVRNVASRTGGCDSKSLHFQENSPSAAASGGLPGERQPRPWPLFPPKTRGEESFSLDFLVYCAMCRNLFAQGGQTRPPLAGYSFSRREKRTRPSVLPRVTQNSAGEPGCTGPARLRASLWKEKDIVNEPHESIRLVIPPDVEKGLWRSGEFLADTVRRAIWSGGTKRTQDENRSTARWSPRCARPR